MKRIPSAVCGLMLLLPFSAASLYAQTATPHNNSPAATGKPAQSATSPASSAASKNADPNAPAPPAHPITAEQTRELLTLMGYKKMQDEGWKQLIANNQQRAPFIPQDVWTEVQSGVNGIDYVAILQPVYAKFLSTEDAAKALDFYRTPAGKRVLESMPSVLGESVAVSQQKGQQVGRDAIEKHRAEIEAAQKKYQAEHAPPTLGPGAGGPGAGGPGAGGPGAGGPGAGGPGAGGPGSGAAPSSAPSSAPAPAPKGSSTPPSSPSTTPPPPQP